MQEQQLHVVFGTGPVGQATARALLARGHTVRMVNRSEGVVTAVLVNGRVAVENGVRQPGLGSQTGFGRFLPAGARA